MIAVIRGVYAGVAAGDAGLTHVAHLDGSGWTGTLTGLGVVGVAHHEVVVETGGAVCGLVFAEATGGLTWLAGRDAIVVAVSHCSFRTHRHTISVHEIVAFFTATAGGPVEALRTKLNTRLTNSSVLMKSIAALSNALVDQQDQG